MKNSKSKKIVSLLLAGCISASMMSVTAWAEKIEGGGYTPIESPAPQTKQETPKALETPKTSCTKDETCTADEHEEGCPLYVAPVPETTCTGDENCTAEEHKEGCPKAEPKDETPELECNCGVAEGEAHKEGCPLYTVPAPETPVVPEAVQLAMEKIASLIDFVAHTEEQIPATDGTTVTKIRVTMLEKLDPAKDEELKELIAREEAALRDETQPALTEEEAARLEQARSAFESAKEQYLTDAFSDAHLAANTAFEELTADRQAQVENASQLADINENLAYIMQVVNTLPADENPYQEVKRVLLYGAKMGGWFSPDCASWVVEDFLESKNLSLVDLAKIPFSFEDGFNKDKHFEKGFIKYSSNIGLYGETLTNEKDNRIWTCVGFVPYTQNYIYDQQVLNHVYCKEPSVENEREKYFSKGNLDDAKERVQNAGGVLYGQIPSAENMQAFNNAVNKNKELRMVCVWYVEPKAPLEHGDYGELSITPVSPVDYQPTSTGISLSCGEVSQTSHSPYTLAIDVTVTIDASAPDQIHVNLNDVLGEAMEKVSNFDHNQIQPGDHISFRLKVNDQSGKKYQYRSGSVQIGTVQMSGEGSLGTGFEGYTILETVSPSGKFAIPRRLFNDALQELGLTEYNISDKAVGKKLMEAGYGNPLMDYEDIQAVFGKLLSGLF